MASEDLLLAPIAADYPAGISLRYSAVWDAIREARREDDALPQGDWERPRKTADLDVVIRLTGEALSGQSKDLQLAAWRTEALLRRIGIAGLTQGLDLLLALMEKYWDSLYPEVEDGDLEVRMGVLEWVGAKLGDYVRRVPITRSKHDWYAYRESRSIPYETSEAAPASKRALALAEGKIAPEEFDEATRDTTEEFYTSLLNEVVGALASLRRLQGFCDERCDSVNFSPLQQALEDIREFVQHQLKTRSEQEAQYSVADEPEPADKPGEESPASRIESVLAAATRARMERPRSSLPYLLVRAFRWGELRDAERITPDLLTPPVGDTRARLAETEQAQRWEALLEMAETEMATPAGRGWLDLQRYVCTAFDALSGYRGARAAVVGEIRSLLSQFPDLPRMPLADGTPAADEATLAWLRSLLAANPGFERAAGGEISGRARFLEHLEMAKECLAAGQPEVARALLEELTEEADRRGLDQWESPDLIVEPFLLLFQNLSGELDVERRRAVFSRICRMNPRLAIAKKLYGSYA